MNEADSFENVIQALLMAMEARDAKLRRNADRIAKFVVQVSDQLALQEEARHQLYYGALLHDIGNIGIPDTILLKPSGLSQWEFEEMKLHTIIGEQICRPLPSTVTLRPFMRSHHEKLDGSGYPDGLQGDQIPRLVRILSVIDVYNSMRSERAYRDAMTHDEAIETLRHEVERGWWEGAIVDLVADITATEADFAPV
jgi:putative two-component system response regulator